MKRILIFMSAFALMVTLTACSGGSGNTASDMMDSAASKAESVVSKVGSTISDMMSGDTTASDSTASDTANQSGTGVLKDGKYTAEGKKYGDDGFRPYVEIEVENGKITEVDCDAVNEKGDFKKDDDAHDSWEDKIELFEDEVELKGRDKITVNSDGMVSGINGLDIDVREYAELLKEAIDKARK